MTKEFNTTKESQPRKVEVETEGKGAASLFFVHPLAKRSSRQMQRATISIKEEIKTRVSNSSEADHVTSSE